MSGGRSIKPPALVALLIATTAFAGLPGAAPAAKKKGFKFGARTLKAGTRGKDVRTLQRSLRALGFVAPVNGIFAPPTRKSVKRLEAKQRWRVNGIVSRKEAKRILRLVARRKAARVTGVYYLQGLTTPTVTVAAQAAGSAQLDVIDTNSGVAVASIPLSFSGAAQQSVSWNGIAATGSYAPDSSYQFRFTEPGTAGASIAGGQVKPFLLRAYAFPVPGKHSFGGAGSRFGASRRGHTHQGQDVSAACGQRLLAAQGGTLSVDSYQAGGAGYYVVIHGINGTDTVYMHMKKPSWAVPGQVIYTGQQIGKVGNTGSSSGCHLHFEHWTAPGWYQGGAPYDPLPELTYWDSYS